MSGAIGQIVVRNYNGMQVASMKPSRVHNPRSVKQQEQRCRFKNIIAMYQSMKEVLRDAFQDKTGKQSDYNRFQGVNLSQKAVYMKECESIHAVVAPYVVSQGSLISINNAIGDDGLLHSNIRLGDLSVERTTTVGELSRAIIGNNEGWYEGDELWFVASLQTGDGNTRTPYPDVFCIAMVITLDKGNEEPLEKMYDGYNCWTCDMMTDEDGCLCHTIAERGGYTFEHRRRSIDKVLVSTQSLVVKNDIFDRYNSEEARQRAIESWQAKKRKR